MYNTDFGTKFGAVYHSCMGDNEEEEGGEGEVSSIRHRHLTFPDSRYQLVLSVSIPKIHVALTAMGH